MKKYNLPFNRTVKDPFSPVYCRDLYTPYKSMMGLIGTDSMTAQFNTTVYNYYNSSFHRALSDFSRAFASIKYVFKKKKKVICFSYAKGIKEIYQQQHRYLEKADICPSEHH